MASAPYPGDSHSIRVTCNEFTWEGVVGKLKDKLQIEFQRRSRGGGDVERVEIISLHKDGFEAKITFSDNNDIFISGLSETVSKDQLAEYIGQIDSKVKPKIQIHTNKDTGKPNGECTITYVDNSAAKAAIELFNDQPFAGGGSDTKVEFAQGNASHPGGDDGDSVVTSVQKHDHKIFGVKVNVRPWIPAAEEEAYDPQVFSEVVAHINLANFPEREQMISYVDRETRRNGSPVTSTVVDKEVLFKGSLSQINHVQKIILLYFKEREKTTEMEANDETASVEKKSTQSRKRISRPRAPTFESDNTENLGGSVPAASDENVGNGNDDGFHTENKVADASREPTSSEKYENPSEILSISGAATFDPDNAENLGGSVPAASDDNVGNEKDEGFRTMNKFAGTSREPTGSEKYENPSEISRPGAPTFDSDRSENLGGSVPAATDDRMGNGNDEGFRTENKVADASRDLTSSEKYENPSEIAKRTIHLSNDSNNVMNDLNGSNQGYKNKTNDGDSKENPGPAKDDRGKDIEESEDNSNKKCEEEMYHDAAERIEGNSAGAAVRHVSENGDNGDSDATEKAYESEPGMTKDENNLNNIGASGGAGYGNVVTSGNTTGHPAASQAEKEMQKKEDTKLITAEKEIESEECFLEGDFEMYIYLDAVHSDKIIKIAEQNGVVIDNHNDKVYFKYASKHVNSNIRQAQQNYKQLVNSTSVKLKRKRFTYNKKDLDLGAKLQEAKKLSGMYTEVVYLTVNADKYVTCVFLCEEYVVLKQLLTTFQQGHAELHERYTTSEHHEEHENLEEPEGGAEGGIKPPKAEKKILLDAECVIEDDDEMLVYLHAVHSDQITMIAEQCGVGIKIQDDKVHFKSTSKPVDDNIKRAKNKYEQLIRNVNPKLKRKRITMTESVGEDKIQKAEDLINEHHFTGLVYFKVSAGKYIAYVFLCEDAKVLRDAVKLFQQALSSSKTILRGKERMAIVGADGGDGKEKLTKTAGKKSDKKDDQHQSNEKPTRPKMVAKESMCNATVDKGIKQIKTSDDKKKDEKAMMQRSISQEDNTNTVFAINSRYELLYYVLSTYSQQVTKIHETYNVDIHWQPNKHKRRVYIKGNSNASSEDASNAQDEFQTLLETAESSVETRVVDLSPFLSEIGDNKLKKSRARLKGFPEVVYFEDPKGRFLIMGEDNDALNSIEKVMSETAGIASPIDRGPHVKEDLSQFTDNYGASSISTENDKHSTSHENKNRSSLDASSGLRREASVGDDVIEYIYHVHRDELRKKESKHGIEFIWNGGPTLVIEPAAGNFRCTEDTLNLVYEYFVNLVQKLHANLISKDIDLCKTDVLPVVANEGRKRTNIKHEEILMKETDNSLVFKIFGEQGKIKDAIDYFYKYLNLPVPSGRHGKHGGRHGAAPEKSYGRQRSSDVIPEVKFTINGITVSIQHGDITKQNVDVICNAANDRLIHAGGVAQAIVKAGGQSIQTESYELVSTKGRNLHMSEVVYTHAGTLDCQFVFHVVGPRWEWRKKKKVPTATLR